MELTELVHALRRQALLIIVSALVFGLGTFLVSQRIPPTYEASTTLLIHQPAASYTATGYNSIFTSENLTSTVADMLSTQQVLTDVIVSLNLHTDYLTLSKQVNVSVDRPTQLIVVSVDDSDPQRAADIANKVVDVFAIRNRNLQEETFAATKRYLQQEIAAAKADVDRTQARLDAMQASQPNSDSTSLQQLLSQYQANYQSLVQSEVKLELAESQSTNIVSVVAPARPPQDPVRPRPLLYAVLAGIIGAILAIGAAALSDYLDDSLRSIPEVERLSGLPVLCTLGKVRDPGTKGALTTVDQPSGSVAEAYRLLAGNLAVTGQTVPLRTIVVTSPVAHVGQSTVVANLAVAFAQIGKQVIVVDAHRRNPRLHRLFPRDALSSVAVIDLGDLITPIHHVLDKPGARDGVLPVLESIDRSLREQIDPTHIDNVHLLSLAHSHIFAARLLGMQMVHDLVQKLQKSVDIVLFDSPSPLESVDMTFLAHECDTTLLLVELGTTRGRPLADAKDHLIRSQAPILGVVVSANSDHDRLLATLPALSLRILEHAWGFGQDQLQRWRVSSIHEALHSLRIMDLNK